MGHFLHLIQLARGTKVGMHRSENNPYKLILLRDRNVNITRVETNKIKLDEGYKK